MAVIAIVAAAISDCQDVSVPAASVTVSMRNTVVTVGGAVTVTVAVVPVMLCTVAASWVVKLEPEIAVWIELAAAVVFPFPVTLKPA